MAANLGSLVATVAANTKPFQSGMKRANGILSQLGQKLGITDKQMAKMAKAAAAAAAAFVGFKKVASLLEETAQRIDDLAKRARALGADINQIAQLTFASALAGGDEQRFFSTMGRLMLNIGQGSTTTRLALKTLGLTLEDLANKTPVEAFLILQEAIKGVENQAERMGIIALIAGGRMENMIPLMNLLGQDVQGFMAEFSQLHGFIDSEAWENYIDALTRLKTAWNGLKMTILQGILPAFQAIVDITTQVIAVTRRYWPLIRNIAIALAVATVEWWGLYTVMKAWVAISFITSRAMKILIIMTNAMGKTAAAASQNWAQFALMVAKFVVILAAIGYAIDEIQKLEEEIANLEAMEGGGEPFGDMLEEARELERLAQKAQQWLTELRTPEEVFADTLKELAQIKLKYDELGLSAQEAQLIWNRGVASALKTLMESKRIMDSMKQAGALRLGTMAEASGRMAAERQQKRQTEYLSMINSALAEANQILIDIKNTMEPPPAEVPELP